MDETPKMSPFMKGVYAHLALLLVGLIAFKGSSLASSLGNPDSRDSLKMAQDWHRSRGDKVTDKQQEVIAKKAEEVLAKMHMPLGTSSDVVWDPTKEGKSTEEKKKEATKYVYRSNVHGYVREWRLQYATQLITSMKNNKKKAEKLGWLTMSAEDFLSSPLAAVRDRNGDKMLDRQDRPCLFLKPLADQITLVNRRMYEEENQEIKFTVCWRNNLHQAVAFASITGSSDLDKERGGIMRPGNSHHGMGLAADIANWTKAAKYLAEIGMVGGCGNGIDGDPGHVSFGEQGSPGGGAKGLFRSFRRALVSAKCHIH